MQAPVDIFISVAETSADQHAAALLRTAARHLPHGRFYGLTGPRMRDAGAETVYDLTRHAAMLTDVLSVIGKARRAVGEVERAWRRRPPALVILLDSPELHLPLAERARRRGLPVLYYIAPQTWASRPWRNRRMARCIDRLACILPFEQPYFRAAGLAADFVGHPLFETLATQLPNPQRVRQLRSGGPLVALLPGSRRGVVDAVLPLQLDVLRRLRATGAPVSAAVSAANADRARQIDARLRPLAAAERPAIVVDDNASLLSAADLVLVASGTATLHVAHYRKPMIVMYDAGSLLGALHGPLGRFVVHTPHLSLVNILAEARVVPEFMPRVPDRQAVARVARQLLADDGWRRLMVSQMDELLRALEPTRASERVCEIIAEMLAGAQPHSRASEPGWAPPG
jgi:lipid-A-disaccharide synthase